MHSSFRQLREVEPASADSGLNKAPLAVAMPAADG